MDNQQRGWVLWWRYLGEPGAGVTRIYLNEQQARDDHELLCNSGSSREWELTETPVCGLPYKPNVSRG